MKIKVTKNECILEEENIVNKGEYNVTEIEFEFSEEYTNDLVKKAIFATETGAYEKVITNNKCTIPEEVLQQKGYVVIGVYAFKVINETLDLRYSPKPFSKFIEDGSYTSNILNSEELTPTDKEQMEQAIQEMETKVDNLDIDANKVDTTTTITITKKDGTTKEVEVLDGEKGDRGDKGDKGDKGDTGPQGEVGATGPQGPIGPQGNPFQVKKTYATVQAMVNDYDNMEINDYVMISGSVEQEDNAKLFVKTETEDPTYRWQYLADFSGASGIQGPTGASVRSAFINDNGELILNVE